MTTVAENNELSNTNLFLFKSDLTNGKEIRVVGTAENPLFIGKDIAEILGYKNTRDALIKHIDEEDKITWSKVKKNNSIEELPLIKIHSQTILINKRGVNSIITYGKKHNPKFLLWLEYTFDFKFDVIKRLTKEEEYINIIMNIFKDEKMIRQYIVEDYKVDLYFPDYNLVIECDENGHIDRDEIYENKRTNRIVELLNTTIIRFNPDDKNFNIYDTINDIFKHIKIILKNKK